MRLRSVLMASTFLGSLAASASASTERLRGIYIPVEPHASEVVHNHTSNLVYLDACWGGCTITYATQDDSRTNRSRIIRFSEASISEFAHGQDTWDAVVRCVREVFEPFNIQITDQPPGNISHFKSIVAGVPGEIGVSDNVGGIAPFYCGGILNNSINYTFANHYSGSVRQICETVAHETAHVFGLDHQYYCPDVMSYLYGCGNKGFQDYAAPCGEDSARTCCSGAATQNSYTRILGHFGASVPVPPEVTILAPEDGAEVTPGFVVRVEATHDITVDRVELWIDGARIMSLRSRPYVFNAPWDLAQGPATVEIRAFDHRDTLGSATIDVTVGEPCMIPGDCSDGQTCVDGRCVAGPGVPGGLGELCDSGLDCLSGSCGFDGTDHRCVESCDPQSAESCPPGFDCLSDGAGGGVCWPGSEGGDEASCGGCAGGSGSGSNGLSVAMLLLVGAFTFGRRRPRQA